MTANIIYYTVASFVPILGWLWCYNITCHIGRYRCIYITPTCVYLPVSQKRLTYRYHIKPLPSWVNPIF